MVTSSDMGGQPEEITAFAIMTSEYSQKTGSYYEFSLKIGYTNLEELSETFSDNWLYTPTEVFSDPLFEVTDLTGGEWLIFEFSEPFNYDASANLLVEISWNGPVDPPDSRIYAMTWEDDRNASLISTDFNSPKGYVTPMVPHILFLTSSMSLQPNTFAGIKRSF